MYKGAGSSSNQSAVKGRLGPSRTHLDVPLQVLLERRLLDSLPQLVVNLQLCRQPLYLPLQVRRRITPSPLRTLPTIPCSRVPPSALPSERPRQPGTSPSAPFAPAAVSSAALQTNALGQAVTPNVSIKLIGSVETLYSHRPHVATFYVPLVLLCSSFTLLFVQHVQVDRRLCFHLENPVK